MKEERKEDRKIKKRKRNKFKTFLLVTQHKNKQKNKIHEHTDE